MNGEKNGKIYLGQCRINHEADLTQCLGPTRKRKGYDRESKYEIGDEKKNYGESACQLF